MYITFYFQEMFKELTQWVSEIQRNEAAMLAGQVGSQ